MSSRPWSNKYPPGIPANINSKEYSSVVDLYDEVFKKFKKKTAFINMGVSMPYSKLDKLSDRFGAYLLSRGLEAGDKVAIMMPNLLQYPISLFGALKAGLIVVNTNPLYTCREMEHQFKDSEVKAIVIADNFAHNLEKILDKTDIKVIITTSIGEMLGMMKGGLVNFMVKTVKRKVPKYSLPNEISFKTALDHGKSFELPAYKGGPETVIIHQYTGGTTGVSKGAMLTNENIVSNILQMKAMLSHLLKDDDEVVLTALPLYHIFALVVNCFAICAFGGVNVLVTNARDIGSVLKEFGRNKITFLTGVNTLFNAMMNHEDFDKTDFSKLKVSGAGGMALQNAVALRWKERTKSNLLEGYGLTEASPVVSFNPLDGNHQIGTIGIPVPSTDVSICDENGDEVPLGEVGEIRVTGPQIMKGYYNRPEETAHVLRNGWLCTGDMAIMQEDGFFRIVDRKKDMILVSGFNVYPNEIEDVVALHPKVLEVAAIGVPDKKSGEGVKIFVVKKDKSLKEDELIQHCRENLTGYKVPKHVEFRKNLPKSNVGKILRRELRETKQ